MGTTTVLALDFPHLQPENGDTCRIPLVSALGGTLNYWRRRLLLIAVIVTVILTAPLVLVWAIPSVILPVAQDVPLLGRYMTVRFDPPEFVQEYYKLAVTSAMMLIGFYLAQWLMEAHAVRLQTSERRKYGELLAAIRDTSVFILGQLTSMGDRKVFGEACSLEREMLLTLDSVMANSSAVRSGLSPRQLSAWLDLRSVREHLFRSQGISGEIMPDRDSLVKVESLVAELIKENQV